MTFQNPSLPRVPGMANLLTATLCGITLWGCTVSDQASVTPQETPESFVAWLDGEYREGLDFSPMAKTRQGIKDDYDLLDDLSEVALDKRLAWRQQSVAQMQEKFRRDQLTPDDQLSWDLWVYLLEVADGNRKYQGHRFIFGRNGAQSRLANDLINYHKVDNEEDMSAYISRLNHSARYYMQALDRTKAAAQRGIRAPYFDYDRTISESQRVTRGAPFDSNPDHGPSALWADITTKLEGLVEGQHLSKARATELSDEAREALISVFEPALSEVAQWHANDRENVTDLAQGAWSLPDGAAYYQQRLAVMTTLPLTADEIHELGVREVARIQDEMREIQIQVNFKGSFGQFLKFMREDEQFYLPNTDAGRAEYLRLAEEYLAAMYAKLPSYFGILPKAELRVKRVEAFREIAGGAAHYARGTKDGSRPGTFYAHLADMRAMTVNRLENLSYHEGVPGHHMQLSIQQEMENLPLFRANGRYTAYSEGWGLYSELLGKEMGGYTDPYTDFGRLSGEIWRAVRLVVDTGIHAKRWSEAQAVEYALANSSRPELSVRSEIRRYFNNPGQATAYKIGMLEIQALRAKAEDRLGEKFDIRAFHDLILGSGPLPMKKLGEQVENWIAANG